MSRKRSPGGGRKPSKPRYSKERNLKEQMDAAVQLYNNDMSLKVIAEELSLNPIKIRKLLITAGVYESDTAEGVQREMYILKVFEKQRQYAKNYTFRTA